MIFFIHIVHPNKKTSKGQQLGSRPDACYNCYGICYGACSLHCSGAKQGANIFNNKNMTENKKYIRKATRTGKRSLSVVIPAEIVDELKIREKQKLVLKKKGKTIIIEDWKE